MNMGTSPSKRTVLIGSEGIAGNRWLAFGLLGLISVGLAEESGPVPAQNEAAWELPAGVKRISVNGYPMAYAERGKGRAVVFVHGALTDYRYWEPQFLSLSAHQRVVALSLRHHFPERWDGKKGDYSVGTHLEDLAFFIEALGVGPVDLVGHSRGGVVAAMLAGKRPDLVRRLVLAEPAIFSLLPVPSGPDPRVAGVKQLNERLANGDIEGALEFFVDSVNVPGTWKSRPESARQLARDNVWTISRQATDVESIGRGGVAALKMPVLLIGGEKSSPMFGGILQAAQRALPDARRVTLPNAGHQVSRDNAVAFDQALWEFLKR